MKKPVRSRFAAIHPFPDCLKGPLAEAAARANANGQIAPKKARHFSLKITIYGPCGEPRLQRTMPAGRARVSASARVDLKAHALPRLKMTEDAEQVSGGRVAIRAEHAHEAVGGDGGGLFELPEANGGVDIVPQESRGRFFRRRRASIRSLREAAPCGSAVPAGRVRGSFHESLCVPPASKMTSRPPSRPNRCGSRGQKQSCIRERHQHL